MTSQLTPETQLALTSGAAMWNTVGDADAGIPSLTMADGPMGIASGRVDERDVALLSPCPTALGASWDMDLCRRIGTLIGSEAVRKGVDLVLAPNVNLARSPLAGRAFEYFSEDPLLAGMLASAWAGGVQSTGTGAVAKHLVCNDSESARDSVNVVVDERTLREVYLRPFEICAEAGVGAMMAAYNRVNGDWCAEQHHVITTIVKDEWGFDGPVMSDWFGTHSGTASLNAGLDLEMPGPARVMGAKAAEAVAAGEVSAARVADAADRIARTAQRFGGEKGKPMPASEAEALLVEAAAAGFVLLRNEDAFLPLLPGRDKRIAVIGPNATAPCYQGGTFAKIAVAPDTLRPLEAIRNRFGDGAQIDYEPGVDPQPRLPAMSVRPARDLGDGCVTGMTLDYFASQDEQAAPVASETRDTNSLVWFAGMHDDTAVLGRPARIRASGRFLAETTGTYNFHLGATGPVTLRIDGQVVLSRSEAVPASDVMGVLKSGDADSIEIALEAGREVLVEADFRYDPARVHGLWYGVRAPDTPGEMLDRAVALAREADAVVLVVGETSDASVESKDRTDTMLPPEQVRLIEAVTAANPRTAIIANVGHAFDTAWEDRAAALMVVWYPGEGFGAALAEVLAGDREPGGRMPVSIASDESGYPALALQPGADGALTYTEQRAIGYPAVPGARHALGAGMGYAQVTLCEAWAERGADGAVQVRAVIENSALRETSEVVQVYRRSPELALAGFAKVRLAPGQRREIVVELNARQLQYWDGGWHDIAAPALFAGRSSADVAIELEIPSQTPGSEQ